MQSFFRTSGFKWNMIRMIVQSFPTHDGGAASPRLAVLTWHGENVVLQINWISRGRWRKIRPKFQLSTSKESAWRINSKQYSAPTNVAA